MVLRINGLGQGPLADRQLLGERRQREKGSGEGAHRHGSDSFVRDSGPSEQTRAEFAALNGAIRETEHALAVAERAEEGLAQVAAHLTALEQVLSPLAKTGAMPRAVLPDPPALPDQPGQPDPPGQPEREIAAHLEAIARVTRQTRCGDLALLDGSLGCTGVAVGDGLAYVGAGRETRSSPARGYEVLLTQEPIRATLLGGRALSAEQIAAGAQLVLRESRRTARCVTRAGQSAAQVAAALQAAVEQAGLALTVEATGDGRLLVQHRHCGAAYRFAAASSVPGVFSTPAGGVRLVANGRDIAGTIHGEPAQGDGQLLVGAAGNPSTAGLALTYTGLPYTGRTGALPRSRPAALERRVFAGRVVVAQQALLLRLDSAPGEVLRLQVDSVTPEHLARGVTTQSGFASLAELRAESPPQAHDALLLVERAQGEVQRQREALQALVGDRLGACLARLRVRAQNRAAATAELRAPDVALQAVQALSRHIVQEARIALSAQTNPSQGSVLGLLGEEDATPRGPRWN